MTEQPQGNEIIEVISVAPAYLEPAHGVRIKLPKALFESPQPTCQRKKCKGWCRS